LRQAAELYSFKHFEDVTQLEEFCTLGLKDVELLLKSDEIQVGCFITLPEYVYCRDVKTVYFSKPVTGLPKPVFYRLPKGLL